MKPSATLKLGTAFGIDVLLHWSFFLLPLLVGWFAWVNGHSISQTAVWTVLLIVVLGSVLLHELGHALTAKKLGIPIIDIVLTPICGLARLERSPAGPWEEVRVAVAGPMVNLVVAMVLGLILWSQQGAFSFDPAVISSSIVLTLFWINLCLFAINLLPIFPMDGGRILRALLALVLDNAKATTLAARLGQLLSISVIILGFYARFYPLVVVGAVLILMAEQEIRQHFLYPSKPCG